MIRTDTEKVLRYFAQFNYRPSFDELFLFFPTKIEREKLRKYVKRSQKDTLGEYSKKARRSHEKLGKVIHYVAFISKLSTIRLIGLSGSVAMNNADDIADVDLFIIASPGRLWTARFLTNVFALLMGLKRSRSGKTTRDITDKVCLNLFFEDPYLAVPTKKQTEFVAHEVLQMKPLVNKNRTWEKFLHANAWVKKFFPNYSIATIQSTHIRYIYTFNPYISLTHENMFENWFLNMGDFAEFALKHLQLLWMSRHRTTELITDHQLWFHPDDFERKIVV